jgi:hypothetical protein
MKKHIIIAFALLCSSLATFGMSKPANAQLSQSSIGPSVEFGNGQQRSGSRHEHNCWGWYPVLKSGNRDRDSN